MIASAPFYWLLCDRCGVKSTEGQEYVAWQEQDQALDMAREADWLLTEDGRHYCPDCTTFDGEKDEWVAKSAVEQGSDQPGESLAGVGSPVV